MTAFGERSRPLQCRASGCLGVVMSDRLDEVAYEICLAIRDGEAFSEELKRARNQQPAACPEVIEALRRRCPGFTTAEYQGAIARGMQASR